MGMEIDWQDQLKRRKNPPQDLRPGFTQDWMTVNKAAVCGHPWTEHPQTLRLWQQSLRLRSSTIIVRRDMGIFKNTTTEPPFF
jgi:hypothetical protein